MGWAWIRRLAVELFVVALAGLVFGWIGPFGSFETPLGFRLVYWIGLLIGGYAMFRPAILVACWLSDAFGVPRWVANGMAITLAALPMSVLIGMAGNGFDLRRGLAMDDFGQVYAQVWLVGALVHGLFHLLYRRPGGPGSSPLSAAADVSPAAIDRATGAPATGAPPPDDTAFARRLPPGFGPLLALAGEDHYVRAIGEQRETLVLVRLRDAITELAPVKGEQVHRSWWVARAALADVRREGRAVILVLTNGREVPVARDKVAALRRAGWLR